MAVLVDSLACRGQSRVVLTDGDITSRLVWAPVEDHQSPKAG